MQNSKQSQPDTHWQPALLLSGIFTILLGAFSVRLQLVAWGSKLLFLTLLAGLVLLVAGLTSVTVSRIYQSLPFYPSIQRLPASLRRWLGLSLIALPGVLFLSTFWVRSPATAEVSTASVPVEPTLLSQSGEYQALADRAQLNATYLPRVQYSLGEEARSRNNKAATDDQNLSRTNDELAQVQADWPSYLQAVQQKTLASFHVDAFDLNVPLEVTIHDTLKLHYQTADYEIEVMTWQAAPGIYMPAVLYKPLGLSGTLPVVITPPACHEDVASNRDELSMQRRMANFALSGMIAFTTEGFCANGIIKDVPGNERRFDYYTLVSGAGISNVSLELTVWLRALDYLATRPDTDMARVAVTGYSNGAGITKALAKVTDRIAVVAVVSSGLPETNNSDFYSDVRDNNNIFDKSNIFYNGTHWDIPGETPDVVDDLNTDAFGSSVWTSEQRQLALNYGAPRPVYFVLGSQDSHYSILDAERAVAEMQQPWKDLSASVLPAIDVVDAVHGYNAEHQSLVRQWFIKVLNTTPLLPPPDGLEYETPILDRKQLEIKPDQYPGITLHELYSGLGLKAIAAYREQSLLAALPKTEATQQVKDLLGLSNLPSGPMPRPILLDDTALPFSGRQIRFQYWLVGSDEYLRSGLLLLYEESPSVPISDISLTVSTDKTILSEAELQSALQKGQIVAVVMAPGYGPLASSQSTAGNLARNRADKLTLLGMGVSIVTRSVDFLQTQWPQAAIELSAEGVDAGNIAYFATALDPRIGSAWVTHGMAEFDTLLTASTQPYVPPTLLVPGILARVSVADLRWLASPREIHLISESDLSEFHPSGP